MQTDYWISFAALTAFWLVLPARQGLIVASYAQGKGRAASLACVLGFLLANLAAALAISHLVYAAATLSPALLSALKWLGGALFALFLAGQVILPDVTGPFADNDNCREKRLARILLDGFAETFFARRIFTYYLVIIPHFLAPAAQWQPQILLLTAATAAPALAAGLYPALAPGLYFRRIGKRAALRRKPRRGSMVSIASGAVTAGYRKIAA